MDWKIYYDDDSTYSDVDGVWEFAPTHGVICLIYLDPTKVWGRFISSGYAPRRLDKGFNEFYVKYPDSIEPISTPDLAPFNERMETVFPAVDITECIKFGRQATQQHWQDIMKRAAADTDFPTGTSPRRRKTDFPSE